MKCPFAWGISDCDYSSPSTGIENELVDIIESLLLLVNAAEDIHCIVVS